MPFDISIISPLSTLFILSFQLQPKESRASLIFGPLSRNSYLFQFSRTIFLSVLLSSFVTFPFLPPPVCQVIFHPSSSCHALPPFHCSHRCCPYRIALGEILSIRSISFFFFFSCFLPHLYILPRRFSRHFLPAIILSLFPFFSFSFHTRDIILYIYSFYPYISIPSWSPHTFYSV